MELSDFELEVMHILWRAGESSAPQVHKAIEQKREVAYTTVKTIIDRLEKKGALERTRQEGRTIFFTATIEKSQYRKPIIRDFINRVFLGNSKPLVAHILEEEELSKDDIQYLEALLKEKKKELK
ncbi:BlaI/MecI/CopY family transcriptional regulator [Aliikangiella sp. G2MR2-5]|uniref:BlaI/MecI/CopY family transcriptional regulator n=1 Tax=Aliikangiella sp. G2MR2-5 TaxID=2788943 RepID=UPI0018AAA4E0|nr:BlaI/MecI/CopY family transcriptional regulator [Aliikangiella sp. G2MR2-5]